MKAKMTLAGLLLLGFVLSVCGCGTEPSGGQLPPPTPPQTAQDFSKMQAQMYSKVAEQGGSAGMPGPPAKKSAPSQ